MTAQRYTFVSHLSEFSGYQIHTNVCAVHHGSVLHAEFPRPVPLPAVVVIASSRIAQGTGNIEAKAILRVVLDELVTSWKLIFTHSYPHPNFVPYPHTPSITPFPHHLTHCIQNSKPPPSPTRRVPARFYIPQSPQPCTPPLPTLSLLSIPLLSHPQTRHHRQPQRPQNRSLPSCRFTLDMNRLHHHRSSD